MNLDITIYNRDIFSDLSDLPRFDIVLSRGFIEPFASPDLIVAKHVELLKKDGVLVLGVPIFRGITQFILKRLTPRLLSMHNLEAMDMKNRESFEKKYWLETIFKAYIGGVESRNCRWCENRTLKSQLIRFFFKPVRILITERFSFQRDFNSIYWSEYIQKGKRQGA